jgi:phage terminase large subunit-like protein
MINHIIDYHQKIHSGEIVAGKWIVSLYDMIMNGLETRLFYFNAKKADKAIRFIENFCRHFEGDLAPQLIKLELWQKAIVSLIFGIVEDDGTRVFREVVIIVGRKNGKSILASAISACMAYFDGEYGANIYCLAPKLEQAKKVFDGFQQMISMEPELSELSTKRRSDIYIAESNTTAKALAFSSKKSDGFNPSFTVCDEIASWSGDKGLKQYEVMKSALGARRQPLILSISTAGYENDGIYDELIKRCTAVLMGSSKERRLLPILYIIDDVKKWNDIEELKKANPNMGVSVSEDFFLEEIAVAENSLSKKIEVLTKYCNIKQSSSVAWLPYEAVDAMSTQILRLEDFKGSYCVGGIDLSQTTDLTAASVVIERKGKLYAFVQFFMPQNRIDELQEREGVPYSTYVLQKIITPSGENYVDYTDVYNWFVMLVQEYEILPLKVGYDRYSSQYLVQQMKLFGFHMDDVYQGYNLTPVILECEGIIKDKAIEIGQNNLLKAHFLYLAKKMDAEDRKCMPVKIEPGVHIDGALSVIDALTVRQKWYEDIGTQLKNEG